ncbi:hypothetical protein L933_09370 [Helicobacter pylori PZ5056]|uniref:DNA (cytosine-5-)-methyltransferase n=1 Tax=Helicobacter pylori PZ5056 TaxID=1337393 RepID=T2T646_HELPX|nr:hypothetical protein L933_09370 [Helicobacter pylori PZ5056]
MLKVASVFSGIGAFEWALKRLDLEHESYLLVIMETLI